MLFWKVLLHSFAWCDWKEQRDKLLDSFAQLKTLSCKEDLLYHLKTALMLRHALQFKFLFKGGRRLTECVVVVVTFYSAIHPLVWPYGLCHSSAKDAAWIYRMMFALRTDPMTVRVWMTVELTSLLHDAGIIIWRPMKDILSKEIAFYNRFMRHDICAVTDFTTAMTSRASIDRLTEGFSIFSHSRELLSALFIQNELKLIGLNLSQLEWIKINRKWDCRLHHLARIQLSLHRQHHRSHDREIGFTE